MLENDGTIEVVDNFPYLGSILHRDGTPTVDVLSRIAKASRVFGELLHPIFNNSSPVFTNKAACLHRSGDPYVALWFRNMGGEGY